MDGRHPPVRLVDQHEGGAERAVDGPTLVGAFLLLRADHDGRANELPDVRVRGEREAAGLQVARAVPLHPLLAVEQEAVGPDAEELRVQERIQRERVAGSLGARPRLHGVEG